MILLVVAFAAGRRSADPDDDLDRLAQAALDDPDRFVGSLSGSGGDEVARVVVADGAGFVFLDALLPQSDDRAYQLWHLDGAGPVSLGVFDRSDGVVAVALPPSAHRLAITEEPSGGGSTPTGPVVARGTMTAPDR